MTSHSSRLALVRTAVFFLTSFCYLNTAAAADKREYDKAITPHFAVPGQEKEMALLNEMLFRHRVFVEFATPWDQWLHRSTLWPEARFEDTVLEKLNADAEMPHSIVKGKYVNPEDMQEKTRQWLRERIIDEEGYVYTMQHRGLAHPGGWPFPIPTQTEGFCWAFSEFNLPPYQSVTQKMKNLDGWTSKGVKRAYLRPDRGLIVELDEPDAWIESPALKAPPLAAPFLRVDWWAMKGMEKAKPTLQFDVASIGNRSPQAAFDSPQNSDKLEWEDQAYSVIRLHDQMPEGKDLGKFRINFGNQGPATVCIQAVMSASDSRHNVNNSALIRGIYDYVVWTGDHEFLFEQLPRLRAAIDFAIDEFQVEKHGVIFTPWVGHSGKSGIEYNDNNKKIIHRGEGVGDNYWDLIPFGGYDALATAYLIDALNLMASIESFVAQSKTKEPAPKWSAQDLLKLRAKVKKAGAKRFWNEDTKRFIANESATGERFDFGFTFVNLEAIYYGLAEDWQARLILDWLDGKRIIPTDTEIGPGIYYWRFGPRATTKRNLVAYNSGWNGPEMIPWGEQIQDGGAVLGFTYFDLMSRLRYNGPDDTWRRLKAIIDWYGEVRQAGGYEKYYSVAGRGVLQGGKHGLGALGVDSEFTESVLAPQVMIYGFAGFEPKFESFRLDPKLPSTWPSLSISDIRFHGGVINQIEISPKKIKLNIGKGFAKGLRVELANEWKPAQKYPSAKVSGESFTRYEIQEGQKMEFTR